MSAPIRSNATKEPIRRLPSLCNSNLPSQGFEKFRTEQLQLVEVPFGGDDGISLSLEGLILWRSLVHYAIRLRQPAQTHPPVAP